MRRNTSRIAKEILESENLRGSTPNYKINKIKLFTERSQLHNRKHGESKAMEMKIWDFEQPNSNVHHITQLAM